MGDGATAASAACPPMAAAPEVNKLAAAIGQEENPFAFVLEPFVILLFTPFALVMAYEFNHILKFGRF